MTRKPACECAAGGSLEGGDDAVDPGFVQRHGSRVPFGERDRAGPDDRPAPFVGRLQAGAALPRQVAARLAPGVGKLNSRDGTLALDEAGDPGQRLDMAVVPDSHVAGRDPPLGRDRRRLDHHQRHAAGRPAAQMDQMPIVGHPLGRRILAHRRHHDPVPKRHAADRERTQKIDLRHLAVVIALRRAPVMGFRL